MMTLVGDITLSSSSNPEIVDQCFENQLLDVSPVSRSWLAAWVVDRPLTFRYSHHLRGMTGFLCIEGRAQNSAFARPD
jgi:hypothetical protein